MNNLADAIVNIEEKTALDLVNSYLTAGESVNQIVAWCNEGMTFLGQQFDQGEAFIPDLLMAGDLMKKVVAVLKPHMVNQESVETKKKLVIGTVQHDIHDIGKDITAMLFSCSGFEVVDLGVDVPPEKFVEAIKEHQPDYVGMSLLLTTCYASVTNTMAAITQAGLRDKVRICVGGAAASQLLAEKTGCDFYGKTAVETLRWAANQ